MHTENKSTWAFIDKCSKKLKAINYLGGRCCKCGESRSWVLSFHHVNSSEKENYIRTLICYRWSEIEKELDKCVLVCENCHREMHSSTCNDLLSKDRRIRNKNLLLEFINTYKCSKCGYNKNLTSLEIHHEQEKTLRFADCIANNRWKTLEDVYNTVLDELDNCIVLCSNCHREHHFDVEKYTKFYEKIKEKSENLREVQKKLDREIIKEMYNSGVKQIEIARHFNAAKSTISIIIKDLKSNHKIP